MQVNLSLHTGSPDKSCKIYDQTFRLYTPMFKLILCILIPFTALHKQKIVNFQDKKRSCFAYFCKNLYTLIANNYMKEISKQPSITDSNFNITSKIQSQNYLTKCQ